MLGTTNIKKKKKFYIQFFFLECRLYLGPFCSSAISWLVKFMFVLFMTLEWNSCFCWGGAGCDRVSLSIFLSRFIQGVTGGMCQTSGVCSLGQTIPI